MPMLGHKPSGNAPGTGALLANNARVTYLGAFAAATWITKVGARMGRNTGTNASARPIFYDMAGPTSAPAALVYAPAAKIISAFMSEFDPATGINYEWNVTGLLIAAGRKLGGGIHTTAASIGYGQDNSGARMYFRGDVGSPPDPYAASSNSPEGAINVWMEGVSNRKPNVPGIVAPASGRVTIDPTPNITISFSDPDEAYGDDFGKFRIEIWNDENDTRIQTSGVVPTTSAQKTANQATWTVPTALPAGIYTVRATTYDLVGVASSTRQWQFTINAGGLVSDVDLQAVRVAGVRTDGVAVANMARPGITMLWSHDNGASTESLTYQIINVATGAVYRSAKTVATAQPDGTTITLGFHADWADIPPGTTRYRYQVKATDALGSETSGWALSEQFVVNGDPAVPLIVAPADDTSWSNRPALSVTITDPNDAATVLAALFRMRPAGGAWVDTPGRHLSGDVFYVSSSAVPPVLDDYEWMVVATDPWGRSTSSPVWTFHFVAPPAVTITAPTGTIATGTPTVTATVDRSLAGYQVIITPAGENVPAYDSGRINIGGTSITRTVPPGKLPNNVDYVVEFVVWTADGLSTSVTGVFRVEYPAPAAMTGIDAYAVSSSDFDLGAMEQHPNVELIWDTVSEATVPTADWLNYLITRTYDDGITAQWEVVDRDQPGMTDTTIAGDELATYTVQYQRRINNGLDIIASVPVTVTASVQIRHTTITSDSPNDPAVTIRFWEDRSIALTTGVETMEVLGQSTLDTWHSPLAYDTVDGTFHALDDPSGSGYYTARDVVETVRELAKPIVREDGRVIPRTLCYRDPKGRSFPFQIMEFSEDDHHYRNRATFRLQGIEVGS